MSSGRTESPTRKVPSPSGMALMPNQAWLSRVRSLASVRSGSLVIAAVSGSTPGMLQRAHGFGVRSVSVADGERAPVVFGPRGGAG